MPFVHYAGRTAFELKVIGLTCLFGYSFFKFGWSYRLFNYCTILFGAIPMVHDVNADREAAERAAENVIKMNIIAAKNFNDGLRTIFLSIGYLGWFISPYVFIASTVIIIVALLRRQFFPRPGARSWKKTSLEIAALQGPSPRVISSESK